MIHTNSCWQCLQWRTYNVAIKMSTILIFSDIKKYVTDSTEVRKYKKIINVNVTAEHMWYN
jgi:hypothetical protein